MKYLIAGLGNIGDEYANTRHNIGFKVLDELAGSSGIFFSTDRLGDVAELKYKGRTLVMLKPSTFMNLSGKSINYWLQKQNIPKENLLVVTDDIALPLGTLRLKGKGGDGGHNGLKSIQETLGNADYARLRFGVGSEFAKGKQVDFVLGKWTKQEEEILKQRVPLAAEMIKSFATIGIQLTMTQFNNK